MRIVVDLQSCQNGSRHRGIGRYAMSLTKEMIAVGKEHEFLIFLTDRFPGSVEYVRNELADFISQDSIHVCCLPPDHLATTDPESAWRTRAAEVLRSAYIAHLEPDMVFIPSPFEGLWDNVVVSLDPAPYPVAATVHDLIPLEDPQLYLPAQKDREAYLRRMHNARQADLLIAISSFVANEVKQYLAVDPQKVIVAYNGIDRGFKPASINDIDRKKLFTRLGISRPFVLNTSPLEARKNLEGLIAAFGSMEPQVRKSHQLVIVGKMDDYARNYLNKLAQAEGLAPDTLVLTGFVPDADLIALYAECALFAFPAWSEGFGLPPLEAMACGAPVIVANTTSLPEVVGRPDMMVDPSSPPVFGQAMQRILTNPALQEELRTFGIERAKTFTWTRAAQIILNAFEKIHAEHKVKPVVKKTAMERPRIAFVCTQIDTDSFVAGRIAGLVTTLATKCDVTLFCHPKSGQLDQWIGALVEYREFGRLSWEVSQFDQVIYAGDYRSLPELLPVITLYPGICLLLKPLQFDDKSKAEGLLSTSQQQIMTNPGLADLILATPDLFGTSQWNDLAEASLSRIALLTLREGRDSLPLLPMAGDVYAAKDYRAFMGVSEQSALIVAIASHRDRVGPLLQAFRTAASAATDVHMMIHVIGEDMDITDPQAGQVLRLQGNIHYFSGPLESYYRGIVSASNLILLDSDVPADIVARCINDVEDLHKTVVPDADINPDLPQKISEILLKLRKNRTRAPDMVTLTSTKSVTVWVRAIMEAVETLANRKTSQLLYVGKHLPGSVRSKRADSNDLGNVSRALKHNMSLDREPGIFIDITAYVKSDSIRRLDFTARQQLLSLLSYSGKKVRAVYSSGNKFISANEFMGKVANLKNLHLSDEVLSIRPGDRIVGLDFLYSPIQSDTVQAWQEAQAYGASLLYFAAGKFAAWGACEKQLAEIIINWANQVPFDLSSHLVVPRKAQDRNVSETQLTDLLSDLPSLEIAVSIFSLDGCPTEFVVPSSNDDLIIENAPKSLNNAILDLENHVVVAGNVDFLVQYTVMGHILGNYSLAIINRAVATSLEQSYPGQTHFLPIETHPITSIDGVPADERPLMGELCSRPRPNPDHEVIISQHWPVMPPKSYSRLALSLFAWEETRVPKDLVQTLTNGFDAIIAPAQCVTDALSLSGCRLPIATIGQPVELASMRALARTRQPVQRPLQRFLHISSCFPRKGVDVLLAAWAQAFTKRDNVELTIKTFPNPHNDVEQQLAALRKQYADMAPVHIINRDVERREILELYKTADVMVLPSRGEGYNLVALEAMIAGLPLIVTGYGGQRDFCGPRQARLIDFKFARSNSHVTGSHSLWVEPDVDDLVTALRECIDPANVQLIEERRQNALTAANIENDNAAWVRRLNGMVHDLLQPQNLAIPEIGWVSTWKIQCGIAEYSNYLIQHISNEQREHITVFSDYNSEPDEKISTESVSFIPAWHRIGDTANEIVAAAKAQNKEALVIQHQDGPIPWNQLARIGNHTDLSDMVTIVILHSPRNMRHMSEEDISMTVAGLAKMSRVLVHNIDDLNYLVSLGLQNNIGLFPHGAFAPQHIPTPRTLGPQDAPVIGCHGFFFRHKGIDKLILTVAKLRRKWPNIKLRLLNARFPDGASDQCIEHCRALANKHGLKDAIEWHLDFLPLSKIEELLKGCDLIVLPYDDSNDSASGAIRTALASMVPLVATRVNIFRELEGAIAFADNNDPDTLVETIAPLLESPEKRHAVQVSMHEWLLAHDWQQIAKGLEDMIYGLVRQKRLGWDHPRNRIN
ncbi:glycosyltransferase [Novacetimonas pomaceti]|nr:glycosyltransferase [Novacetimonas pomaceti]